MLRIIWKGTLLTVSQDERQWNTVRQWTGTLYGQSLF